MQDSICVVCLEEIPAHHQKTCIYLPTSQQETTIKLKECWDFVAEQGEEKQLPATITTTKDHPVRICSACSVTGSESGYRVLLEKMLPIHWSAALNDRLREHIRAYRQAVNS